MQVIKPSFFSCKTWLKISTLKISTFPNCYIIISNDIFKQYNPLAFKCYFCLTYLPEQLGLKTVFFFLYVVYFLLRPPPTLIPSQTKVFSLPVAMKWLHHQVCPLYCKLLLEELENVHPPWGPTVHLLWKKIYWENYDSFKMFTFSYKFLNLILKNSELSLIMFSKLNE